MPCVEIHLSDSKPESAFNAMFGFDPNKPAQVHDQLNDRAFEWDPEWKEHWDKYASHDGNGVFAWDGLLIDGWRGQKGPT